MRVLGGAGRENLRYPRHTQQQQVHGSCSHFTLAYAHTHCPLTDLDVVPCGAVLLYACVPVPQPPSAVVPATPMALDGAECPQTVLHGGGEMGGGMGGGVNAGAGMMAVAESGTVSVSPVPVGATVFVKTIT